MRCFWSALARLESIGSPGVLSGDDLCRIGNWPGRRVACSQARQCPQSIFERVCARGEYQPCAGEPPQHYPGSTYAPRRQYCTPYIYV